MKRNSGSIASTVGSIELSGKEGTPSLASAHRVQTIFEVPRFSVAARLTVSVVICTRKRPDDLRQCLERISALTPGADEVLVVDNSSGDAETEHLAELFGARYVLERTPGLSRARNRGLWESRCDIVAYLDDDCLPDPLWLEYLLRPFSDTQVAAVAGEIIRFTNLDRQLSAKQGEPGELRYVSRETPRWFEIASFGGIGSGGNMAFRRQACQGMILFDERLGRGAPFRIAEENCAFVSLLTNGHSTVRFPKARVYHPVKPRDVDQEAKSTIAYWLLLFGKFPENRLDLVHFLIRRILRQPTPWRLEIEDATGIVSSRWGVKLKAIVAGIALFFRERHFVPGETDGHPSSAVNVLLHGRNHSQPAVAP